MTAFLQFFIILPLVGFALSLLIPRKQEGFLSRIAFLTGGLQLAGAVCFLIWWIIGGFPSLNLKDITLFKSADYEFAVDFCFDKIVAVYLIVGALLTFLVTVYSRYYMHREEGYKRFFNAILFFYLGYNICIFSGNFETLFIGWEILGVSSFLLIAFYRDRYLPAKNAVKVFSVYRIGDVGLLLAMWMSHHLWHENITFLGLKNAELVHEHLQAHSVIGVFISVMILVSAAAKSAQLPFSSWLPRAMEGPTPSSAIFYGSLSVHLGVFLLLRTYAFWEEQISVRILIGLSGFLTAVVATGIARVQSSVKSQIAYASITQIGLIFIEVAAGFDNFALFHFAGNAFLRTYQLLVSPSVVTYLIREQFYNFRPREESFEASLPKKIQNSFYILCLKEWNLDSLMYRYLWNPLKWAGKKLGFMTVSRVLIFFTITYLIGLGSLYFEDKIPLQIHTFLPYIFSFLGLVMVLRSFVERKNVQLAWLLIVLNHFWIALAISFNEHYKFEENLLYLSGIVVAGIIGHVCIYQLSKMESEIDLQRFHGQASLHPKMSVIFLAACLGLTGFPITTTFIGEDLIFSHIQQKQLMLALFVSLSFIIDGLSVIRIFARLFMGPQQKTYHGTAYRSS